MIKIPKERKFDECPNCGMPLTYNIETGRMYCIFCMFSVEI